MLSMQLKKYVKVLKEDLACEKKKFDSEHQQVKSPCIPMFNDTVQWSRQLESHPIVPQQGFNSVLISPAMFCACNFCRY